MGRGKPAKSVVVVSMFISAFAGLARAADGVASSALACTDCFSDFTLSLAGPPLCLDLSPDVRTTSSRTGSATTSAAVLLHKGLWDFELSGAHMASVRGKPDRFNAGSAGIGYFVVNNISLNAAFVGYAVNQPDNGAFAAGLDVYARWYFLTLDRISLYADGGAGAFIADKEVPEHGTHFNFTPRGGIGVAYRFDENAYFLFGSRFWHLSNAGAEGDSRNPSFDGIQYYGSVMFTF